MSCEFNIGDRVRMVRWADIDGAAFPAGMEGTITDPDGDVADRPGVRWDDQRSIFHTCNGTCEDRHGWYVPACLLELVCPDDADDDGIPYSSDDIAGLLGI